MKVNIGNYTAWFGPYQLAEFLCFWERDPFDKPDYVHKFGEFLAHGSIEPEQEVGEIRYLNTQRKKTLLYKFLLWIESKKERKIKVQIDKWDTWSADHTLAYIILPLLKKIKEENASIPAVENEDVPEELHSDNLWCEKKWEWVLDQMIFSFQTKVDDNWEDEFYSGEAGFGFKKLENGYTEIIRKDDSFKIDIEGRKKMQERITNGFILFGKYYEGLWT